MSPDKQRHQSINIKQYYDALHNSISCGLRLSIAALIVLGLHDNSPHQPALEALLRNQPAQSIVPPSSETIDTLSYFLGLHPRQNLQSARGDNLSQINTGNSVYHTKLNGWSFEHHKWDPNQISLELDSGSQATFFTSRTWLYRHMVVGQIIEAYNNRMHRVSIRDCNKLVSDAPFPYRITLEAHIPNYDAGGDLGVQNVIVVRYTYSNSSGGTNSERFIYSNGWGWIGWELWQDDQNRLLQRVIFNRIQGSVKTPKIACPSQFEMPLPLQALTQ